ncbi:MAG: DM13 domain-containing protein [Proteobacteria bacterium]|nr:DM13 domain-containing protein [Pseudomonadota bacterium]MDA1356612.1 DM13 domain-containing protein [Pseudomonadota bacterium]
MPTIFTRRQFQLGLLAASLLPLAACAVEKHVDEPAAGNAVTLASGTFVDVDGSHGGRGTATIYREANGAHALRLSEFEVTPGPDLVVYLVDRADIRASADVTGANHVALGALKGSSGNQNYQFPANVDPAAYSSVVIWCESFSVLFSAATLN